MASHDGKEIYFSNLCDKKCLKNKGVSKGRHASSIKSHLHLLRTLTFEKD